MLHDLEAVLNLGKVVTEGNRDPAHPTTAPAIRQRAKARSGGRGSLEGVDQLILAKLVRGGGLRDRRH
jgi:hypothetical protein